MQPIVTLNIRLIHYFDDERANKILYKATQKLMRQAIKHYGNETLMLLNTENCKAQITSQNNTLEVNFTPAMLKRLNKETGNDKYAIIHNHPFGGTFTYLDVIQLLKYPRLKMIIACSNDCKQYFILYKTEKVDDIKAYNVAGKLTNIITNKDNGHDLFLPILKQLQDNGIVYKEFIGGQHEQTI